MVQIGIAVPFLVISGVMLDRVRTADFGFPTDGLAAARLPGPVGPEREAASHPDRFATIFNRPAACALWLWPTACRSTSTNGFFGSPANGAEFATAQVTRVGENFLETVGAKLLRGRTITAEDRAHDRAGRGDFRAAREAAVSGRGADRRTGEDHVEDSREEEFTIVGVTADFATSQLTTERPQILLPLPEATRRTTVHLIARGAPGDEPK